MNELILNDRIIQTDLSPGITLLDFVRYEQHLKGTKIGCREGDCGACTVLLGSLDTNGKVRYRSVTSCISPLGNAFGKHVVTIDGLTMPQLTPVQQALVDEGGSQCGFCTPGFAVSLTGYCLSCTRANHDTAVASVDGNICRCTGYKSIERSIDKIVDQIPEINHVENLVRDGFIPEYFTDIPEKLKDLKNVKTGKHTSSTVVGGGTDLYVQIPDDLAGAKVNLVSRKAVRPGIEINGKTCRLAANTTATEMLESEEFNRIFPDLNQHLKLVSSTPIRNMGTLAGNLVNASPIGDLTIFFLALNATVTLSGKKKKSLPLREFYLGYKTLAKAPGDLVEAIEFRIPKKHSFFNFEKVCKRTHLDIASVNSAMLIKVDENRIKKIHLSAGGIGPTPSYLEQTSKALRNQSLTAETIKTGAKILAQEISPISDVRGSEEYKRLLLRQLYFAHFLKLFPDHFTLTDLI